MTISESTTTILFDEPFWIALFERIENGKYSVAKVIIGTSEPEGVEIAYFFENLNYDKLEFTKPINEDKIKKQKISFKKQKKIVKKATTKSQVKYVFSKAQTLLKEQFELNKKERKQETKAEIEEDVRRKFELKQLKRKEKQRGH